MQSVTIIILQMVQGYTPIHMPDTCNLSFMSNIIFTMVCFTPIMVFQSYFYNKSKDLKLPKFGKVLRRSLSR